MTDRDAMSKVGQVDSRWTEGVNMTHNITTLIPRDKRMSTTKRLRLVADLIEAEPGMWDQGAWHRRADGETWECADNIAEAPLDCGTTCCVAGWAIHLAPRSWIKTGQPWEEGRRLLGLDGELGGWLFDMLRFTYTPTGNPRPKATQVKMMCRTLRALADMPATRTYDMAEAAGLIRD